MAANARTTTRRQLLRQVRPLNIRSRLSVAQIAQSLVDSFPKSDDERSNRDFGGSTEVDGTCESLNRLVGRVRGER
jgi:hypothetical protein